MRVRLNVARLRTLLAESRLSQNHWAMRVGVSRGHWSDIVNGRHPYPSARTRRRILDALNAPFDDLFTIEEHAAGGRAPKAAGPPSARRSITPSPVALVTSTGPPRAVRRGEGLMDVVRDVRIAYRSLRRDWRFALAFVVPLALGVGAGATFYSVVDTLLFRPPPHVRDAQDLIRLAVTSDRAPDPFAAGNRTTAWMDYDALARRAVTLDEVAGYRTFSHSVGRGEAAHRAPVALVTASYFRLLGVAPARGRFFQPDEDRVTASNVPCVAGDRLWRRELGGTDDALGRELIVGEVTCTIVGVAPPGFNGLGYSPVDLWIPLRSGGETFMGDAALWNTDGSHWISIVARPKPGLRLADVEGDATMAYRTVTTRARRDPGLKQTMKTERVLGARSSATSNRVRLSRWLVGGAAALLLLVAANLVNLLVARNLGRLRDTSIRLALGGSRIRIFFDHALECVILSAAAGAGALFVVQWLGPTVRTVLFPGTEFADGPVTSRIALVAAAVSLTVGGLIAALAALSTARIGGAALLDAGTRFTSSRAASRARLGLVAVQAALSLALLVASTGFVRSFRAAAGSDLGFDINGVLFAEVPSLGSTMPDEAQQRLFYLDLQDRLNGTPGVERAALGSNTPWSYNRTETVSIPGRATLPPVPLYEEPVFDAVTPGYLDAMRLTIRAGRWIADTDAAGAPPVMVISESLARLYWPDRSPIGYCVRVGDPVPCREIVGVVADTRFTGALDAPSIPLYYLPMAQAAEYGAPARLFIRVRGDAAAMAPVVRRIVQGARPALPASEVHPMQNHLDPLLASWRLGAMSFSALGVLAVLIALLGLFSVMAHAVAERRREFAIRHALGARRGQIVAPVLRQGGVAIAIGLVIGLAVVWQAAPWLQPQLFHVDLLDPAVLVATMVGLMAAGCAAAFGPARRAAGLDPAEILRAD